MTAYIPERGEIVLIDLDPRVGHEQSGHHPALVVSPVGYTGPRGLLIASAMTSRIKGGPFEVDVSCAPRSVVLVDHIRSVDWRARGVRFRSRADPAVVTDVVERLSALVAD